MANNGPQRPMQNPQRTFDDAKLESMTEPLMVRVEKIKGGTRMPIPLPAPDDGEGAPGTNYTKELVRSHLEQFLVTQWVGGGSYEITVTDSTAPQAISMKWSCFWDPKQYPELVPPPLASATNSDSVANVVQLPVAAPSTPFTRSPMPPNPFPNGFPHVNQAPTYPMQPHYPMPAPPPITSPAYGVWAGEADRQKQAEELRQLRAESAQREREAVEARHKADMERIRMEAEAKVAAAQRAAEEKATAAQRETERRFAELQATIATLAKPTVSPELEAIRAELATTKLAAERAAEAAAADRRDRDLREAMKAQADATERRFEQMMTTITTLVQNTNNRPDPLAPVFTMMQEQARSNADAIKEVARQNSESMTKLSAFMMNPRDMISMARDTQVHTEATAERMSSMFGRAFDLQARAVESVMQANQGGSQTAELVGMGMEKASSIVDRWIGGKTATEKFHAQAQAETAQAQARAIEAQAAVELSRAGAVVTPAPTPQGQLSGPQVAVNNGAANQPQPQPIQVPTVPTFGKRKRRPTPQVATTPEVKRLGRTDREWFTSALMENVENTREGVAYFHASAMKNPPRLDKNKVDADGQPLPEGISAPEVAMGILQAVQMVQQAMAQQPGVQPPPAMMDLLFQERYADFIDVLLPDASQKYRDDVVQSLLVMIQKATGETPSPKPPAVAEVVADGDDDDDDDDDDEDDEDDDEDGDDDDADDGNPDEDPNDGKVVDIKPKTPPKSTGGNGRARA